MLNGKVWTGEHVAGPASGACAANFAKAVAMRDGRIVAVGSDEAIRPYIVPNTKVIDLDGRLAVPGFNDAHVHFLAGGFQLLQADLRGAKNEREFVEKIRTRAKSLKEDGWLLGGGWDEETWPGGALPTCPTIDSVTRGHPAYLHRYDRHAALANSQALKLAGITKNTPDPPGGSIVRDPATGEPTGILLDAAQEMVRRIIPRPGETEAIEAMRAALQEARRVGVTSVGDMNLGGDTPDGTFMGGIRILQRAEAESWLTCRFYEIVPIVDWQRLTALRASQENRSDFIRLGAVKAFADGSMGSRTAWMFEPYSDNEGNFGFAGPQMTSRANMADEQTESPPESEMASLVQNAAEAGLQVCIHAIGPRAVAEVLDIMRSVGGAGSASRRFRIEHAQHMRRVDFSRMAALGVIASMQPYHAIDDGRWIEKRIGKDLARWSYAWRSMLEVGAVLAFGTDWPVAPLDPLLGIYAAVTRATLDGKNAGGWIPEEKITVEEALRAYTAGSAFAAFQENDKGTITDGKLGDIAVLSDDLFSISPERIRDVRVEMTIVGGELVYKAD